MNFQNAAAPQPNETDVQYRVFMAYALSEDRNLTRLARDYCVGKSTIFRWRRDFHWDTRIKVIDATVRSTFLQELGAEEFQRSCERINRITQKLLEKLESKVDEDFDEMSFDDIISAGKAAEKLFILFGRSTWADKAIQAIKEIHAKEIAEQTSEENVKVLLPKPSQRTMDPDDDTDTESQPRQK